LTAGFSKEARFVKKRVRKHDAYGYKSTQNMVSFMLLTMAVLLLALPIASVTHMPIASATFTADYWSKEIGKDDVSRCDTMVSTIETD
jgi:hypothetical protein